MDETQFLFVLVIKWYRTRDALQIPDRIAGASDIFRIDRFKDKEYLYCDQSCVAVMVGFSTS